MTNEKKPHPQSARKPQQILSTFGALLALVATKIDAFVIKLDAGEATPLDTMKIRGALDIVQAGLSDASRALDSIDGGA